jgi:choline dehydrogenase-like flavoprotein
VTLTANKESMLHSGLLMFHVLCLMDFIPVILSAGAVGTPQLLLLSGIGPKDEVSAAGIESLKDLPDVGMGLQDQPILFIQYRVNNDTLSAFMANATEMKEAQTEYAQNKSGILSSNVAFNNLAFLRLPDNSSILQEHGDPSAGNGSPHFVYNFAVSRLPYDPRRTLIFISLSSSRTRDRHPPPRASGSLPQQFCRLLPPVSVLLLRRVDNDLSQKAGGSIKVNSSSVFDSPVIDPAFFETDFDIKTMTEAIKTLQNFVSQSPFQGYITETFKDAADLNSDDKIAEYIRTFSGTNRHAVSSASISNSSSSSGVVGPDLSVKQTKNLRVIDASIIVSQCIA